MAFVLPLVGMLTLVLLLVPPAVLISMVLLLWLSHYFLPAGPTVARASFDCPFSKRRASVEYLIPTGSDWPSDVLSCSVFPMPEHIRCKKGCLSMAEVGRAPSPMMPRYALLSGGVAKRPLHATESRRLAGRPTRRMTRAA